MTNSDKAFWSPQQVYEYLVKQNSAKQPMILPDGAYCTENFTWNEVLRTKARQISLPSIEILENLKYSTEVLQVYRTKIGKKIEITSSWRTPAEQQELIRQYKAGLLENMPSTTSLHLEGLALDFQIKEGGQQPVQGVIDKSLIGEMEPGRNYTHLGLTTFSKSYLKRHGIYRNNIYRQLYIEPGKLTAKEREVLIKRINPKNWHSIPDKFVPTTNAEFFKNTTIGKKDAETTPKLPEIKIPLPDENEARDTIIEGVGNPIDTLNGNKPYLEGHVEENVYKDETHSDEEQGQHTGYSANLAANNSERELLEQLKNNSIADIGIADKIRNEGKILEKFINNQVKNNSKSAKPSTQEELEKDELCQRLKKERGRVELINSNEFSWEQILKDTLEFPNIMRDFCYPSEKSSLGKSSEIFTNISDIRKNECYTLPQRDEKPKITHGRYLNSAHEEEIERVVSKIFDSVARDMGYSK